MYADMNTLDFGKYSRKTVDQVADIDILYLDWLLGQDWFKKNPLFKQVEKVCNDRRHEIENAMAERDGGLLPRWPEH
jgi:hypothetical protein